MTHNTSLFSTSLWDYSACKNDTRIFPHFLSRDAVHQCIDLELSRQAFQELIQQYFQSLSLYWNFLLDYYNLRNVFMQHFLFKNINYIRRYKQHKRCIPKGIWKLFSFFLIKPSLLHSSHKLQCFSSLSSDGLQLQFSLVLSPFASKAISVSESCELLLTSSKVRAQWWNRVKNELFFPLFQLYLPLRCLQDKRITHSSLLIPCPPHIQQTLDLPISFHDISLSIREKTLEQWFAHRFLIPLRHRVRCTTHFLLWKQREQVRELVCEHTQYNDVLNDDMLEHFIQSLSFTLDILIVYHSQTQTYECIIYTTFDPNFVYVSLPFSSSISPSTPLDNHHIESILTHIIHSYQMAHSRSYEQLCQRFLTYMLQKHSQTSSDA